MPRRERGVSASRFISEGPGFESRRGQSRRATAAQQQQPAASRLTPHASRLTQIQLTAAGFCAPQLLFARAGISLGSAVVCWSSFVAPRVAFSCMQHQQLLALVVVSCKGLWSRARAARTLAWVAHGEARRGWCRRRGATRASRAPAARSAWRQGAMAVSRKKKIRRVHYSDEDGDPTVPACAARVPRAARTPCRAAPACAPRVRRMLHTRSHICAVKSAPGAGLETPVYLGWPQAPLHGCCMDVAWMLHGCCMDVA